MARATDVKEWGRRCVTCCRANMTHVQHSGVEKIPIPGACFSDMHVDLVGPLPASRDESTYLQYLPRRGHSAGGLHHHVGGPLWHASLHHHRQGTQFTSGTWGDWCPVHHHHSLPPPGQWLVEWIHHTLKAPALCARGGATAWKIIGISACKLSLCHSTQHDMPGYWT